MGRPPAAAGLACAVLASLAVVVLRRDAAGGATVSLVSEGASTTARLVIRNAEYGAVAPSTLYPFEYIAEAHRESFVALADGSTGGTWSASYATSPVGEAVGLALGGDSSAAHGYVTSSSESALGVVLTLAGAKYVVESSVYGAFDVYCKYVRRELRSLSDGDRRRFFRAAGEVHSLGLEAGIAKYGSRFTNYEALTIKHLDQRTLLGCTPYHGADVFLTAHAAFTRDFEVAVAAVEPTAGGAPYWDYTLDDAAFGRHWATNSSVFSAGLFGAFADDATFDDKDNGFGRALPLAAQGAMGFDAWPEANAWGTLTEAWNTDASETVRRSRSLCGLKTEARLPGCAALRGAAAAATTTDFRAKVEYDLHAELHTAVGGAWDCAFPPKSGAGLDLGAFARKHPSAAPALENVALNLNLFWRGLFNDTKLNPSYPITCPRRGDCVRGTTSASDCACRCERLDEKLANASGDPSAEYEAAYDAVDSTLLFELAAGGSEGTRISDFISYEAGTPPRWRWLDDHGETLEDGTDNALTTLFAKLVFHPASAASFTGPLAAPNDPLFWPSHSLYEKLWAYKRLDGSMNETWDYDTAEDAASAIPSGCWGFARDARLPFYDLFGEDTRADYHAQTYETHFSRLRDLVTKRDATQGGYTNAELHAHLNPNNVHLPFVYEHFRWDHCAVGR